MLKVPDSAAGSNVEIGLFADTNVAEMRRAVAWFDDRTRRGRAEVFSEVVRLTPAMAELLLQKNPANRNVRDRLVEIYATDIRNGDWHFNGETLKVSTDGLLNDGQHRCHAVVRSGTSIETAIIFGVSRDSRMTVDQGGARTAGNYLAMTGQENSNQTAAVASLIWQITTLHRLSNSGRDKPTKAQIMLTVHEHPGIADSIKAIPSNARVGRSRSVLAFCHYIIVKSTRASAHADSFFLRLVLGEGLSRNDPIYHCRERLLSSQRIELSERVEIILRTWNAHRKGQKQTKCSPVLGELPAIAR